MHVLACAASLSLFAHGAALAWGDSGHSIIAELAQRRLSASALAKVADLIGPGTSLASLSSWADDFKFTPAGIKTKRWHFIDLDVKNPDPGLACKLDQIEGDCTTSALKREIMVIADEHAGRGARADALKLVVHLVGDIHQPLHCSERAGDGGGNGLAVTFQGKGPDGKARHADVSFHQLWDETLIGAHSFSWGAYTTELETSVMPGLPAGELKGDYVAAWANECFQQGIQVYQHLPAAPAAGGRIVIDETYQKDVQPILDRQLALGGIRLAELLSETLGKPADSGKAESEKAGSEKAE
ncbi:S1/P1 nuclease [Rhizobium ruizarguesonis]|uniref:S1/P1 nuclease n=1 Tax=Rhizobium ruizarguesonis TaxID=2081791 RepID=UPI0016397189|nr:S1/P1 nuclease [Rhizobium ruizarguesonis]MBC2806995.1 S1/P1 nuclease [Rhizobium ruizarguesonis]